MKIEGGLNPHCLKMRPPPLGLKVELLRSTWFLTVDVRSNDLNVCLDDSTSLFRVLNANDGRGEDGNCEGNVGAVKFGHQSRREGLYR